MTNSFTETTANLPTLRKLHLLKPELIVHLPGLADGYISPVYPDAHLHMAIHGFVWKKLQNRLMSTIFKSPHASVNLYSFTETTFVHLAITTPNTDSIVNCLYVRPDNFVMGEKI